VAKNKKILIFWQKKAIFFDKHILGGYVLGNFKPISGGYLNARV